LSFASGNNNVCEFGIYDSQLPGIRVPSRKKTTASAAGRNESVAVQCVATMKAGDFVEVHCANTTGANNITVEQLNFIVTEIK